MFSSNKTVQRNYKLLHFISCPLGGNKQKIVGQQHEENKKLLLFNASQVADDF